MLLEKDDTMTKEEYVQWAVAAISSVNDSPEAESEFRIFCEEVSTHDRKAAEMLAAHRKVIVGLIGHLRKQLEKNGDPS